MTRLWMRTVCLWLVIIILIGGCQNVNSPKEQELLSQAESKAIQFFKDTYQLDVEMTESKKMDASIMPHVLMKGHVIGQEEQRFNISYDYEEDKLTNYVMSAKLEQMIRDLGYDPFAETGAE